MRLPLTLLFVLAFPLVASADSYYLPIAGSVGNFRTDVRIYNPSDFDSHVNFFFVPVGNIDHGEVFSSPVAVTIAKKSEASYDDFVATALGKSGIGAVSIEADTSLVVTTRIYAQTASGTLGQGYRAERIGNLLLHGVLLQLRADASFRTNIGIANLQNTPSSVTFSLYDRHNTLIGTKVVVVVNYGIIGPTSIVSADLFGNTGADLSDAYVTFSSDVPVGVYASVIDNATTDPTFFSAEGL